MTETQLKIKVLKYLRDNYPQYWVYKTHDMFQSGIPDLLLCADAGKLVAIELKAGKNKLTPIQQYVIDKINSVGGIAGVARSIDEVKILLDKTKKI